MQKPCPRVLQSFLRFNDGGISNLAVSCVKVAAFTVPGGNLIKLVRQHFSV